MIKSDVDLDFGDRNEILSHIIYTSASLENGSKHNSGIYITNIPQNPFTKQSSLDYKTAENLGYFKLDILNQSVYKLVKNPEHLEKLLSKEPNWQLLHNRSFVEKLVQIGNYYDLIQQLPEPIDSVEKLAMFISIIRPGKKHLQGKTWDEIKKTVWNKSDENDGYTFKRSHSIAYSILVCLHMNILEENK